MSILISCFQNEICLESPEHLRLQSYANIFFKCPSFSFLLRDNSTERLRIVLEHEICAVLSPVHSVSSKIIISHILINLSAFRLPCRLSDCPVGFQIALSAFRLPCRLSDCPVGFCPVGFCPVGFALSVSVCPFAAFVLCLTAFAFLTCLSLS